jgi:hypothetical protein
MTSEAIYLDYAATTPVDPRVAEHMAAYLTVEGDFGNPASETHAFGQRARAAVEQARYDIATAIGGEAREIVFTSGATEADNLALKGVAAFQRDRGRHIITSATEHKAVLDTCEALEFSGFEVTRLQPAALEEPLHHRHRDHDPDDLRAEVHEEIRRPGPGPGGHPQDEDGQEQEGGSDGGSEHGLPQRRRRMPMLDVLREKKPRCRRMPKL